MMLPLLGALAPLLLLLSASARAETGGAHAYDVAVEPVHEVCLEGAGEPGWAAALLAPEGLSPALLDGRAQLTLCATSARFGGRTFSEAIFSVAVEEPAGGSGAFLVAALNSRRSYAWVERRRNRSPYAHGAVLERFGAEGARLRLGPEEAPWVTASTALQGVAVNGQPERFEGAIYQPGHTLFYARLEGEVSRAPWSDQDALEIAAGSDLSAALSASAFTPTVWRLRAAGRHAKTKTIQR